MSLLLLASRSFAGSPSYRCDGFETLGIRLLVANFFANYMARSLFPSDDAELK